MTVGIVGGGVTGLALSHYLADVGVESVAFEASGEPGGVVRSSRTDGRLLEHGPQRLRCTPAVAELVDDLALNEELREANDDLPLYVYHSGKLRRVPVSVRALLHTDLFTWRGKARLLAEPLTDGARPDETVAELFTRKFGPEAYRNVVEPLFGGIYGSDPAEMPVRHSLSRVVRLEEREGNLLKPAFERMLSSSGSPAATFHDGMQQLPEALYAAHDDRVELSTAVTGIRDDGDGYVLETKGKSVAVDRVVVTTPADVTADLLASVASGAGPLRDLEYNPLALVHLQSDHDRDGFGYQVRRDESLHTLGVSWNASIFDRDGVFTGFLGGMNDPELLDEDDDTLGDLAAREFEAVTGSDATPLNVTRLRRGVPAHDRSWSALDELDLPDDVHLATNYTGRIGVPSRIREAKSLGERLAGE